MKRKYRIVIEFDDERQAANAVEDLVAFLEINSVDSCKFTRDPLAFLQFSLDGGVTWEDVI